MDIVLRAWPWPALVSASLTLNPLCPDYVHGDSVKHGTGHYGNYLVIRLLDGCLFFLTCKMNCNTQTRNNNDTDDNRWAIPWTEAIVSLQKVGTDGIMLPRRDRQGAQTRQRVLCGAEVWGTQPGLVPSAPQGHSLASPGHLPSATLCFWLLSQFPQTGDKSRPPLTFCLSPNTGLVVRNLPVCVLEGLQSLQRNKCHICCYTYYAGCSVWHVVS